MAKIDLIHLIGKNENREVQLLINPNTEENSFRVFTYDKPINGFDIYIEFDQLARKFTLNEISQKSFEEFGFKGSYLSYNPERAKTEIAELEKYPKGTKFLNWHNPFDNNRESEDKIISVGLDVLSALMLTPALFLDKPEILIIGGLAIQGMNEFGRRLFRWDYKNKKTALESHLEKYSKIEKQVREGKVQIFCPESAQKIYKQVLETREKIGAYGIINFSAVNDDLRKAYCKAGF